MRLAMYATLGICVIAVAVMVVALLKRTDETRDEPSDWERCADDDELEHLALLVTLEQQRIRSQMRAALIADLARQEELAREFSREIDACLDEQLAEWGDGDA